ncbi:16S rRNA (cytosine967-C5)-methyltransferase [Mesorhizobium sp. J18]|uniref:RsmB/NOP family class I SAM-dependent RNA methyltransferase n=1 Tax=Mesorhizobium sp. J18 TaxID=935263 RepID=UPI001199FFF1|nr:RsmB/NOP family class I SAM-dependent RNA methyltransferase [Mesorhizobium sp. J18]TWG89549.1 16S rRNA (cytosine967-C5)-methyltransferase [Mesorhizobium sp. J18]
MRLGGRLSAAIEILDDIEARHRPAADALKDWGLSHRFAGAGDRGAIGNIVYGALRRRRSSAWLLGSETSRALAFGAFMLENTVSPEALNAELDGDRFAPPPLDAGEIGQVLARDLSGAPHGVRADCPEWCEPLLERSFGVDWVREAAALALRPPLDMRVNTLKTERQKVLAVLARNGAAPCRIAPDGIRIPPIEGQGRHPNVQAEPAFQKGWFEVQDEGSQIVARLAGAEPGMQVLDLCAGAGGKTLALSAAMQNRGQIFAFDAEKQRLAPIFDRLKRAGCRNVQVLSGRESLAPLQGQMDLVLVDAPCTGSGTWRRRPDAKWRLTTRQLENRQAEQQAILDQARQYVKPGGRLVYITCSVFCEENSDQIEAFLGRISDFEPLDHDASWKAAFPAHPGAAAIEDHGISLTPHRTGTDGFFFAALRRSA